MICCWTLNFLSLNLEVETTGFFGNIIPILLLTLLLLLCFYLFSAPRPLWRLPPPASVASSPPSSRPLMAIMRLGSVCKCFFSSTFDFDSVDEIFLLLYYYNYILNFQIELTHFHFTTFFESLFIYLISRNKLWFQIFALSLKTVPVGSLRREE